MTFSILARDPNSGEMGCAAATGNLCVGAWVLRARAGAGCVATQGYSVSSFWGDDALTALQAGESAESILERLIGIDSGADYRQLLILDARGGSAGWTGEANVEARGHWLNDNIAIGGNWLRDEQVIGLLRDTFGDAEGTLAERLLAALKAGADAGSDSRGTQSAAIQVVSPSRPAMDLRIDFSERPVDDLIELYRRATAPEYAEFLSRVPSLENPYQY